MVIVIDAGRYRCVVIVPFGLSNLSIVVLVAEAGQEFGENFLCGHFSADDFGGELAIEYRGEVSGCYAAISIEIKLAESLVDKLHALFVGHASHSDEELVIVDEAIFVCVETLNKNLTFAFGNLNAQVLHTPVELLLIELAVSIIIDDAESSSHSSDGLGALLV